MPTNQPTVPEMEPDWDSILEQLGLPPEPPAEPASSSGPTVTAATKPAPSATKSTPTEPTEPTEPDSFAAGLLADEPALPPPSAPPEPDGHSTSAKTTLAGTVGLTGPGSGGFAPPSAARREHASPALTGASVPFGGGLDEESPLPVADPALAEPSKVLIVSDEEVASFAWSEPISNEPDTDLQPSPAVAADDLPAEPEPLQPSEPSEPSEPAALAGPVADADSELEPEPGEDGAEDSVTESEAATESEPTAAGTEPPKGKRRRRRRRSRKKKAAQQSATVATEPAEASAPDAVDPQAATATPAPASAPAAAEAEPLPLGSAAAPGQPAVTPTEKPSGRGKQRRSKGQRSSAEPQQPSAKSIELDETQDQPSPARNQTFLAGEDTSKYSEELLQTLRNWNVPSWSELIAGLYRPER